ncbi:MAG: hypothetical protein JO112_09905 [Planctomycetes bacterium]|nr:hypothetical protein [Planctomycetota bacterium]
MLTRVASIFVMFCLASAGNSVQGAEISGKITVEGKPLVSGRILFYLDKDQFVGAKVKDGAYSMDRVPEGTWTVTVEGEGVSKKYQSEETSALRVIVKKGSGTFDFDLRR